MKNPHSMPDIHGLNFPITRSHRQDFLRFPFAHFVTFVVRDLFSLAPSQLLLMVRSSFCSSICQFSVSSFCVAVGMEITPHPPRGSVRAHFSAYGSYLESF